MRIGSVLVPRSTSQASIGPRIAPSAFWMNRSHSMWSSRVATTTPPTLSLWPLRNFVVLWMTRSAPNSIGRWMYGLAKVLSTATTTFRLCATSHAAARSVSRSVGLVGVSRNSIFVCGPIAAAMASVLDESTYVKSSWYFRSTRSNSRYVPPYVLSVTTTWSPDSSSVITAPSAAIPEANANAALPPSMAAMLASRAERVGFCVRAYSYPLCLPSASWT
jgi:hypothetical protein